MNPPSPPLCAARVRTNTIAYKRILHTRALTRADTPSSPACARTHVPRRTRAHESARTSERARGGAGGAGGERHGLCPLPLCVAVMRARPARLRAHRTHSHTRTAAHPHTSRRFRTRTLACTSARPNAGAITRTHARTHAQSRLHSFSRVPHPKAVAHPQTDAHAHTHQTRRRRRARRWCCGRSSCSGTSAGPTRATPPCCSAVRARALMRSAVRLSLRCERARSRAVCMRLSLPRVRVRLCRPPSGPLCHPAPSTGACASRRVCPRQSACTGVCISACGARGRRAWGRALPQVGLSVRAGVVVGCLCGQSDRG